MRVADDVDRERPGLSSQAWPSAGLLPAADPRRMLAVVRQKRRRTARIDMKARTSISHPLRIDELACAPWAPGTIGITFCPGKCGDSIFDSTWPSHRGRECSWRSFSSTVGRLRRGRAAHLAPGWKIARPLPRRPRSGWDCSSGIADRARGNAIGCPAKGSRCSFGCGGDARAEALRSGV